MECCHACPALWLGGSDNTQVIKGNSGHAVTWWAVVKHWVSANTHGQAKSCFSKGQLSTEDGRVLLQNPKAVCCDSPIGTTKGSKHHSYLPLKTSSSPASTGSYGLKGRAACAAAWTCCRTFSCSRPYSNEQLSGPLVNGPETQVRNMLPPASKEANWVLDLLLVVGGARCNNLSLALKGIYDMPQATDL